MCRVVYPQMEQRVPAVALTNHARWAHRNVTIRSAGRLYTASIMHRRCSCSLL